MISEGLNLALFGMGVVFIFLLLLILVTKLMSFFLYDPQIAQNVVSIPIRSNAQAAQKKRVLTDSPDNPRLQLVFAAAIKEFKKSR